MEYLDFSQIVENRGAIEVAFGQLMGSPILVSRPNAKQWQFFRNCFKCLMGEVVSSGCEDTLTKVTAAQYKFEVERKLVRYYQRTGIRCDFVFALIHLSSPGILRNFQ